MVRLSMFLIILFVAVGINQPAMSQDAMRAVHLPDIKGVWSGKADFMVPDGVLKQIHRFEFSEQSSAFVKGVHHWENVKKDIKSHDGKTLTHAATEPFLGVIGYDGTITLVEHGDNTLFRMRLINRNTLEFIAMEGGENPVVGHGVVIRE